MIMNTQPLPAQPVIPKTCPFAIVSLVVGILSFCIPLIGSAVAITFGIVSLNRIKSSSGGLSGRGMAIAGIILGCVSFALIVVWIIIVIGFGVPWDELSRNR